MSNLETAGKDFCKDTGCDAPFEVIALGIKPLTAWCQHIAKCRSTAAKENGAKAAEVLANVKREQNNTLKRHHRKQILECITDHCQQHPWGILVREVAKATGISDSHVNKICAELLDEGHLTRSRVLRSRVRADAHLYRIPGMETDDEES